VRVSLQRRNDSSSRTTCLELQLHWLVKIGIVDFVNLQWRYC
jgi:hypothetical protein